MATKASTSSRDSTTGAGALDRLSGSLDAAGDALKDLRRELSKGGRDLINDLDVLVRDARKNLRGARRTYLVHGEPGPMDALKATIESQLKWRVHTPAHLEQVEIS